MTTLQIIFRLRQIWPKNEPQPSYIPEASQWTCTTPKGPLAYGDTVVEALFHYITLCQIADKTQFGQQGEKKWEPALSYMEQFVPSPLDLSEDAFPLTSTQEIDLEIESAL